MTRTITLVACSAGKLDHAAPAEHLYTSQLFRAAAGVARLTGPWYVLSARHHLVHPREWLEPYDVSLQGMPRHEREWWAMRTAQQLLAVLEPGDQLQVLAGKLYRQRLLELVGREYPVSVPLEGLGIGQQKRQLGIMRQQLLDTSARVLEQLLEPQGVTP